MGLLQAVGEKFLSDDLTAQTKGQILGGSPSAAWDTPSTRWDWASAPSTARGRREGRGWELGSSQPLILAQETEERPMAVSVQTLRTARVCSESDGGRGLVKPPQRLSQLFLPRCHTDPCGESRPWLPGAHWEIRPTSE